MTLSGEAAAQATLPPKSFAGVSAVTLGIISTRKASSADCCAASGPPAEFHSENSMFDCPPHSHTSPTSRSETDVWASSAPDTASVIGSLEAGARGESQRERAVLRRRGAGGGAAERAVDRLARPGGAFDHHRPVALDHRVVGPNRAERRRGESGRRQQRGDEGRVTDHDSLTRVAANPATGESKASRLRRAAARRAFRRSARRVRW